MGLPKRGAVLGRLKAVRTLFGSSFFSKSVFPVFLVVMFALARTNSRVSIIVSGPVHFEQIPKEHWYPPSWINETKAKEERDKMEEEGVIYGGSQSYVLPASYPCSRDASVAYRYRNMCRFNSGVRIYPPLICQ
jgi:hypothetical protein